MNEKTDLLSVLKEHEGEHHITVIQDYPDPDAIGSAFAHQLINEKFNISLDIVFDGKISHLQNKALVNLLGLDMFSFQEEINLDQYDGAVFIDNQGTTASSIVEALEDANVPALIVVDHHEPQDRLSPAFCDIRRVGATATIYATYLEQGLFSLDPEKKDHILAATALMHGILTDTKNMIRAGEEDIQAALYLCAFYDRDMLEQIMSQPRSKRTMEIIHVALGNRNTVESYSIAGIGYLRSDDRDAIPQAADFLLSEENVHTAIVYGIVKEDNDEETLIGSLRSNKLIMNIDQFIKDTIGRDESGFYYGGGKLSAGGFEIPLSFLSGEYDEDYQDQKWDVYDQQMKHKILTKIGVEEETENKE
ncbi:MAG: DHH family phosphoesterase [Anaerolineales bacterium]